MSDHCGSVTEDGAAVCTPGSCSCSAEAKNNEPISLSIPTILENNQQEKPMWEKIRGGVIFGVACITSPCCTPIIIPIALALLAGTPVAIWASTYIGWAYGGLTLISVLSLVLGIRWMGQKAEAKRSRVMTRKAIAAGDI